MATPKLIKFEGSTYALTRTAFRYKSKIPDSMKEEYGFAAVAFNQDEVQLLSQLHMSQDDPVYAITSRSVNGPTWVSEEEVSAVVRQLHWLMDQVDAGKQTLTEQESETLTALEYELNHILTGAIHEYPEGVIQEFDMDDTNDHASLPKDAVEANTKRSTSMPTMTTKVPEYISVEGTVYQRAAAPETPEYISVKGTVYRRAASTRVDNLELYSWWGNVTKEYQELVLKILASVPGGEVLEDVGYEPFPYLGWQEFAMIGEMMDKIEDKQDVETVIKKLVPELFETEDNPAEQNPAAG